MFSRHIRINTNGWMETNCTAHARPESNGAKVSSLYLVLYLSFATVGARFLHMKIIRADLATMPNIITFSGSLIYFTCWITTSIFSTVIISVPAVSMNEQLPCSYDSKNGIEVSILNWLNSLFSFAICFPFPFHLLNIYVSFEDISLSFQTFFWYIWSLYNF